MIKKIILSTLVLGLVSCSENTNQPALLEKTSTSPKNNSTKSDQYTPNLDQKTLLKNEYPKVLVFRGDAAKHSRTEVAWHNYVSKWDGCNKKFISEELNIDPQVADWARKLLKVHPEKLVLWHLNGEARQARKYQEVLDRYFPGHWAYFAGTWL